MVLEPAVLSELKQLQYLNLQDMQIVADSNSDTPQLLQALRLGGFSQLTSLELKSLQTAPYWFAADVSDLTAKLASGKMQAELMSSRQVWLDPIIILKARLPVRPPPVCEPLPDVSCPCIAVMPLLLLMQEEGPSEVWQQLAEHLDHCNSKYDTQTYSSEHLPGWKGGCGW